MSDSNDLDDLESSAQLVPWLRRIVLLLKWRRLAAILLIFFSGIMAQESWHLKFPKMDSIIQFISNGSSTSDDSATQPLEEIQSIAKDHMKKIYRLSKCETDWLYSININKIDFEDERIARELKQKSRGNVDQERSAMDSWRKSQESNLEQRISATKSLLLEIERLSMQIANIWSFPHSGVGLDFNCVE